MQDAGHTLGPVASTSTQTTDPQPGSEVVPTHPPIEPASSSTQGQVLLTADPTICADPGARETAWFDHEFLDAGTLVERDLGGGGLAVADFDGDGWLDLFTASARPALWRSIGGTTFAEDPTSVAGIDLVGAVGASAADADDDGDVDVLVTRWNAAPILLINDGTGQWSDGTAHAGLGSAALGAGGSSWADFDGDGDLDLIIAGYGAHPPDPYDPLMPPGAPSRLYRANGDGSFEDASTLLPAATLDAYAFQHAWFDLDLDGLPELFTAADYGWIRPSTLLRNLGGAFEDAPEFGFLPEYAAMGVGVGDLGGDGLPDFAITSVKDLALMETLSLPGNSVVYVDRADARGIRLNAGSGSPIGQDFGWGVELVDVDANGLTDLMAVFGYWSTWPTLTNEKELDGLWMLGPGGSFGEDIADDVNVGVADPGAGRGLIAADLNRDGYPDFVRGNIDAPYLVSRSRCGDAAWLRVSLDQGLPNAAAVGARVQVIAGDLTLTAWIDAGGRSLFSGGPPEALFGLGDVDLIDELKVVWPDGSESKFADVATRQSVIARR